MAKKELPPNLEKEPEGAANAQGKKVEKFQDRKTALGCGFSIVVFLILAVVLYDEFGESEIKIERISMSESGLNLIKLSIQLHEAKIDGNGMFIVKGGAADQDSKEQVEFIFDTERKSWKQCQYWSSDGGNHITEQYPDEDGCALTWITKGDGVRFTFNMIPMNIKTGKRIGIKGTMLGTGEPAQPFLK